MKCLRILIVENEVMISESLAELLKGIGHKICSIATSEDAAVSAAERLRPDLMIVDVRLAQGNGIEAVNRILQSAFIPHIIVSGDRLDGLEVRQGRVLLSKPYFAPELFRAIKRAVGP